MSGDGLQPLFFTDIDLPEIEKYFDVLVAAVLRPA